MKQQYLNDRLKRKFKDLKRNYEKNLGFSIDLKQYFKHLLNLMEERIDEIDNEVNIEGLEVKRKRVRKDEQEKTSRSVVYIDERDKKRLTKLKREYESKMGDFFEIDKVGFIAVLMKLGLDELGLELEDLIEED